MKGLTSNAAFVAWAGNIANDDALILKILWDAGCVFYARTTEPQILVSSSCVLRGLACTGSKYVRDDLAEFESQSGA